MATIGGCCDAVSCERLICIQEGHDRGPPSAMVGVARKAEGGNGCYSIWLTESAPRRSAPKSFPGRLIFAPKSGILLRGADSVPGRILKVQ